MEACCRSAGVIVIRLFNNTPHYLMLRVFNYWDFPKGLVDEGEEPLQAAIREVAEETALTELSFHWGYDFRETEPYGHGKVARYYVAESSSGKVSLPVSPELGHPEHDEYRWMVYQQARDRLAERVRPILDWANRVVEGGRCSTGS